MTRSVTGCLACNSTKNYTVVSGASWLERVSIVESKSLGVSTATRVSTKLSYISFCAPTQRCTGCTTGFNTTADATAVSLLHQEPLLVYKFLKMYMLRFEPDADWEAW